MAVKEVPARFKASDGEEFGTKKEAQQHEELIKAREAYEEARRNLGRLLARREKTADGRPFDFSILHDYYYITEGWAGMPELTRVNFDGWNFRWSECDDRFEIQRQVEHRNGRDWASYNIGELYWFEDNAEKALLAKREEWLKEQAEKVEEFRQRVAPAPVH
jgi:hypothetical protein